MEKKKRKLTDNFILLFLATLVLMLVGQILGELPLLLIPIPDSGFVVTALMYLEFWGIWAAALIWFAVTKKNRPMFRAIGREPAGNNWRMLLLGFAIGFGLNAVCILAAWLHGDIHMYFDVFRLPGLLAVFAAVFVQSSAEELLCRGFLYQRLLKSYRKPAVAIVGNAALFGLLHLGNQGVTALSVVNIVVVGILFSLMVYYMDSLWCAMAVHTAWNYTQNIIFGLPNSGMIVPFSILKLDAASASDSFFYNVGFGIEGTAFADIVLIAACVVLWLWGRKYGRKPLDIWTEAAEPNQ